MTGWRQSTWGEEISLEYGKSLRDYSKAYGPVRVYGSNGPIGYTSKALSEKVGVILGRKGAYRGVEYSRTPFFVIDTAYYVIPKTELDMRWIYYAIKHHKLGEIDDGSPIPSTTRAAVYVRDLDVPELEEQKIIAEVLGALDDKIELNHQINMTLEASTRALFKSWFVDFNPVRAKLNGKKPFGMDDDTAALFPSNFISSPLGDIPKGWEVKPLDQIAKFLNGIALQKYPAVDESYLPVIKISQIRQGNSANADKASNSIPSEYIIDDGDIIFSWSGSLMQVLWTGGKGALNQHLFKVTSDDYPKWLYYLWIEEHMSWFQAIAASKATTMGHIQRQHLEQAKTLVPSDKLLKRMDTIFAPIFAKRLEIGIENSQLSKLRDYLLPRLISGAIRIPNISKL